MRVFQFRFHYFCGVRQENMNVPIFLVAAANPCFDDSKKGDRAMNTIHVQKCRMLRLIALGLALTWGAWAQAANVLIMEAGSDPYGYGQFRWVTVSTMLDEQHSVTVTSDLSNLSFMMLFDALWIGERGSSGTLSPSEISNISSFLATGRKVVMFGEWSNWANWNNQILGIVGGSFAGDCMGDGMPFVVDTVVSNELTSGVFQYSSGEGNLHGCATGGTSLFSVNAVTLWDTNVLTIMDTGSLSDDQIHLVDNLQFAANIVAWLNPSAPRYSCVGFEPPLAGGTVKVRKNRVLPLKATLIDENGLTLNDSDISTAPVVQVMFDDGLSDAVDVSEEALPTGAGTEGNNFEFLDGRWQFNLGTKNYSASGTYLIAMESGDSDLYVIDPTCVTAFVID